MSHHILALDWSLISKWVLGSKRHQLPLHVDRLIFDFHVNGVESIGAIGEFDHLANRIPHGAIVVDHQVFEALNQSSLEVASFGGLDRRIDQTFTTSHRVKEEFGWCKTRVETVLNETTRRWDLG
jgi:hypothetical protein